MRHFFEMDLPLVGFLDRGLNISAHEATNIPFEFLSDSRLGCCLFLSVCKDVLFRHSLEIAQPSLFKSLELLPLHNFVADVERGPLHEWRVLIFPPLVPLHGKTPVLVLLSMNQIVENSSFIKLEAAAVVRQRVLRPGVVDGKLSPFASA